MQKKELEFLNFTSNYLGILKKLGKISEITDGDIILETIQSEENPQLYNRSPPHIIYDKFSQEEELEEPDIKIISDSLMSIKQLGLEIISRKLKKGWRKKQSVEYKIRKKDVVGDESNILNQIPLNHKILYDRANLKVKLIGPNCKNPRGIYGETEWINLKNLKIKSTSKGGTTSEQWAEMFDKEVFLDKKRYGKQAIEDIPVMVAIDGSIVCIPHRHETNNISIVGKKGCGKTLLLHRIADEIFWHLGEKIIIMNDIQEECYDWNKKQENPEWTNQLLRINEIPTPLPIIYVYPHTNELRLDYSKLKKEINFIQITIPFSEVLEHGSVYLKLGDSIRYILGLKKELLKCENPDEVKELIEDEYSGTRNEMMRNKMLVSFENIFNEEILNITKKEYPYKLASGSLEGNPFVILTKLGLIPCFETYDLSTKRYMPEVFAYHLDCVFQSKFRGKILEGENVYIFFDEITQICSDEDKNSAYDSLCRIATRGRKLGIGMVYATQNYSKIPRKIKTNTDFVFAFQHSNEEEVNRIKKDFDLIKINKDEIMNLENFEVMGITNQYFVCYKEGKNWVPKEKVIKGRIIPPFSNHMPPS